MLLSCQIFGPGVSLGSDRGCHGRWDSLITVFYRGLHAHAPQPCSQPVQHTCRQTQGQVCTHSHVCTHTRAYTITQAHIQTRVQKYTHMHTHTHTQMHPPLHTHTHTHTRVHAYAQMPVHYANSLFKMKVYHRQEGRHD